MPEFKINWTDRHVVGWERYLGFIGNRKVARGLEIGCLEGRSSLWFCEHLLHQPDSTLVCIDPYDYLAELTIAANTPRSMTVEFNVQEVYQQFQRNTRDLQALGKIEFLQLEVPQALRRLQLKEQFDFAYIDGCHLASAVLSDAIHVWPYLHTHGIIVFDDVGWTVEKAPFPREVWPSVAIEAFKTCFVGRCRELGRTAEQVFVEKLA